MHRRQRYVCGVESRIIVLSRADLFAISPFTNMYYNNAYVIVRYNICMLIFYARQNACGKRINVSSVYRVPGVYDVRLGHRYMRHECRLSRKIGKPLKSRFSGTCGYCTRIIIMYHDILLYQLPDGLKWKNICNVWLPDDWKL